MASDDPVIDEQQAAGPLSNPWPALVVGLAAMLVGCLLAPMENLWTPLLATLIVVGMLATGAAVAIRPSAPAILGLAAFASLLGSVAAHSRWDSIGLLLAVGAGVATVAALVMLLPRTARRVVVSLLIVFHFVGILTAVTSVQPSPWISAQLWTRVYRPYLQFMYLNNAYHFYSPDPGPAQQLWFRVAYTDEEGKAHGYWLRVPDRDDNSAWDPLYQSYQRRLSITESTNQFLPSPSLSQDELICRRMGLRDPTMLKRVGLETWHPAVREQRLRENRPADVTAAEITPRQWELIQADQDIPFHPELGPAFQYREPALNAQKMLQTYARHVFHSLEEEHPDWKITGVKIYRVEHRMLDAKQFGEKRHFDDPTLFIPYYQGEYDREGRLKDDRDRYLWWVIPIEKGTVIKLKKAKESQLPHFFPLGTAPKPEEVEEEQGDILMNYLKKQAGDEDADDPLPPYKGEWK